MGEMQKKLLIIPIAHSEVEMGSLSKDVSKIIEGAMGKERRDKHREEVDTFWRNLKEFLARVLQDVDMAKVKIYQDGVPIGGDLGAKLAEDCAKNGSLNFQIVSALIGRGATLEKTEDAKLLKEEYEILKDIISAKTAVERERLAGKYKKRLYELTAERDKYIAGRIKETLGEGMLGILFIGATHNVSPHISPETDAFVCNYKERDVLDWLRIEEPL